MEYNEFLILKSSHDLLKLKSNLENAISILQGGRTLYRIGFFKENLELSFKRIKESKPYGLIYTEETDISEFFTKFLTYLTKLSMQSKKKFELFISYFLDSCTQLINLENRIVNLFIALEIIDNSKTLNKNTLKKILDIDINDADFAIKVRNHLIHKGHTLRVSIEESRKEMVIFLPHYQYPFKTNLKRKVTGSFYFYLLSRTYNYILTEIGMANLEIAYKRYYE